jgi:hypothetical protein
MAALGFVTGEMAEIVWTEATSAALLSHTVGVLCVGAVAMLAASAVHDTVVSTVLELRPVSGTSGVPPRLAETEVLQIMREHPGVTLQMGVSDKRHFDLTYVRPVLHMAGQPLITDPSARSDNAGGGMPVSDKMVETVRACRVGLWLIPKGGVPFEQEALFYDSVGVGLRMLYSQNFREAFFASYRLVDSHYKYYDLWGCTKGT